MNTVFLDIETTGLDPWLHEILEVAVVPDDDGVGCCFALDINVLNADKKALEVNRYHERREELKTRTIPHSTAADVLSEVLKDAIVVGNNPQFDLRFIEHLLVQYGVKSTTPWNYHPVDLKALVAGRYGLSEPPWSTTQIAEAVGVPLPDDAHSALADANWNRLVYKSVFLNG